MRCWCRIEAIVTDQTRQVVYVVGPEGVVGQKVVRPGRLIDGLRVIREGLSPQDRVVISGVQRARPGRKVTVTEGVVTAFPTGVSRGENSTLSLPQGPSGGDAAPDAQLRRNSRALLALLHRPADLRGRRVGGDHADRPDLLPDAAASTSIRRSRRPRCR